MRSRLGQILDVAPDAAPPDGSPGNGARPNLKEIPYDYVATFRLTGKRGERVQDVINTSVDGAFVAVAIGYSFIPAALPALPALPDPPEPEPPPNESPPIEIDLIADLFSPTVASAQTQRLLHVVLGRLVGIDFKYSIIDSAVGRELQNKPIHNIAGLGEVTGQRPFRPMAKPMLFMPRSTIRIEIEEISTGPLYAGAELQIVLHGYKILGYGTG